MPPSTDISGKTYGRLTVIEKYKSINGRVHWSCQCTCGKIITAPTSNLSGGNTTSCGCQRAETIKEVCTTHGLTSSPEYQNWAAMKSRCNNRSHKDYPNYGGRGIKVCKRWSDSFEAFLADMGCRPTPSHTVDRRDGNEDYTPNNCRWATTTEQSRNRSVTRYVEYEGQRITLQELADQTSCDYDKLKYRLNRGCTVENAIAELKSPTTPKWQRRQGT